jgi:3',5'-cyclic AMP phosphodiesterase CpdA
MATFVLAHLSDAHLAPLPQASVADLIGKRFTGYMHWRRTRHLIHRTEVLDRIVRDLKASAPDHIAVTGDLVNIALASEFAPARAWLETLGSPQDVTLVPGNHDAYVRAAAALPQAHWGEYMRGDTGETSFPFVRRRGPLALIGLSSAVPTPIFMATGRLGSAQLDRLAETLTRLAREDVFRVVLVHHPLRSKPSRYHKRLIDGPALRDVLARHGAELVIHGHDHEHAVDMLDGPNGPIAAVGVPSASQAASDKHEGAGYHLYRIEGGPGAWRCEMVLRGLAGDGEGVAELKQMELSPSSASPGR